VNNVISSVSTHVNYNYPPPHAQKQPIKKPGWICSKAKCEAIDDLLGRLRVPSGWPKPKSVLTGTVGLKIAEALALCGNLGAYTIGLTDIDPDLKATFISLFGKVLLNLITESGEIKDDTQAVMVCAS
jgi:hypothetical protein